MEVGSSSWFVFLCFLFVEALQSIEPAVGDGSVDAVYFCAVSSWDKETARSEVREG